MNIISGTEAKKLIEEHNAILVDVRNTHEFATGAVPGAVNVPLHVLPVKAQELIDMAKPVILYCVSGARSMQAQMLLQSMGYATVKNVGSIQNFMNS